MKNIKPQKNDCPAAEATVGQKSNDSLTAHRPAQNNPAKLDEIKKNITWLEGFRYGLGGVFHVKQGRKTLSGLLNAAGEIVLEPQPKMLLVCSESEVILFRNERIKGDKHVLLDLKNNITYSLENNFDYSVEHGNVISSKQRRRWGVVDIAGNIIIPYEYRKIWRTNDAFIALNRKNKFGVLDSCGKEQIPFEYDFLASYRESCHPDRFSARQGEDYFVIDRSGQRLSEKRYDYLDPFTESGYAIFGKTTADDGWPKGKRTRYGVIDKDERVTIPAVFDFLQWFLYNSDDNWLSCGKTDRWNEGYLMGPCWKYGVINSRGNMIISPRYHDPLYQGPDRRTYVAWSNNEYSDSGSFSGVINEEGRIVVPFRDWQILIQGNAYRIYDRQLMRCGLYSPSGEEILPFEFDHINWLGGDTLDFIAVCKDGEWYYVNQHGERVLL